MAFITFRFSNRRDKSQTIPKTEGALTVLVLFPYSLNLLAGQSLSKHTESSLSICSKLRMKTKVAHYWNFFFSNCMFTLYLLSFHWKCLSELRYISPILCLQSSGLGPITWHKHLMTQILLVVKSYFQKKSYYENPSNHTSNLRHSDTIPLRVFFSVFLAFPTGF